MSSVNMLNTGRSALIANKAALTTTGHNIANINTEGFSRQRVEQTSQEAHPSFGQAIFGTGVKVKQVTRINDEYLTRQISKEQKNLGSYEEKDFALSQTEAIFNEMNNEGLNRLMSNFFNEFRKLGNQPENESLRMTVRESTEQLTGDFHRISGQISEIQRNIDNRITSNVNQANELIKRIAHLNGEVSRMEISGGQAGDLRDKRDLAVKELSTIMDIASATNEKGELTLSLTGVGSLVSGQQFNELATETTPADPDRGKPEGAVEILIKGLLPPRITHRLEDKGKLGGLVHARDQVLGTATKRMNELAFTFATKVNEVHRQGYGIDGGTGRDFFEPMDSMDNAAQKIRVSDAIKTNVFSIAAAVDPDSPGDNRLVQRLASLQYDRLMSNGRATFDDHYNATVADVATVQQKNKQLFAHQKSVSGQLEKFRESISGVSLDEETSNLIQFQHAFDAAARVIKIADEIMETVLNLRRM